MVDILMPVLGPFLNMPPVLGIALICLILTFLINIVYKYTTNQKLMKELKDDLKKHQDQVKKNSKDPAKMMEIQKKMMDKNLDYMKHSFKSSLYTMIPILLIFGWLSAHFAYEPILPNQEFSVTAEFIKGSTGTMQITVPEGITLISNDSQEIKNDSIVFKMKGVEGEHLLEFKVGELAFKKDVKITTDKSYSAPEMKFKDSIIKKLTVGYTPVIPINIFGLKFNWLWTYILFSVAFNIVMRKLMKLY